MSEVVVDELVMRIEVELDKFRSQAQQAEAVDKRLRKSLKDTEEAAKQTGEGFNDLGGEVGGASKQLSAQSSALATVTTRLISFLGVVASSGALQKMANNAARLNDELNFLSQRLGMLPREIKALEMAVSSLGGSGASVTSTMKQLNQGIQEMVLMGNDALIPFFSALGVGVVDASGGIREMDDILLDMADSLSQMNPQQAYALAEAMGLDGGVANALIQGRDALQEQLDLYDRIYVSREEDIKASRELSKTQALLSAQWEGLKTIIGNALIPVLTRMTKIVSGWLDYLNRNERTVKNIFEGLSIAIGVVLLPILVKAAIAMFALISPVLLAGAAVVLLAGAFALLYDDYKTWADGGNSLFDWGAFKKYIDDADFSVDNLGKSFMFLLTGYESLEEADKAFKAWLREKGIIDENGLSVRALGNAFKDLARDIYSSVPALKSMVELISAVIDGRWGDALDIAKGIPAQSLGMFLDAKDAVSRRVAGSVDVMLGHTPGSAGSLSGSIRNSRMDFGLGPADGPMSPVGAAMPSGSGALSAQNADSIARVARELGMEPNDLAQIISFETGGTFNPNARNPRSSATGLIQKMADPDGKYYGYTRDELGAMSFEDQMQKVVKRYFQERGFSDGRIHSLAEGYEAVAGSGYKKGSRAYELNKVWDANGDGVIDRHEAIESPQFRAHQRDWMGGQRAMMMSRGQHGVSAGRAAAAAGGVEVSISTINVQTSATTLPAATADGVAAGVARGGDMLNQLGGGM